MSDPRTPIIRAFDAISRQRRALSLMISSVVIGVLLAPILALGILPTPWAAADGGDFSIDFVAAGPFTYNHVTGVGGQYDGRLISKTQGVNESLEGGDFSCGDKVVYFAAVQVDAGAIGTQNIQIDFEFASEPTGQGTIGIDDLELAALNVGDTGNLGLDGNESASIVSENLVTAGKDHLDATVAITNLNAGERFILRLVTLLTCPTNDAPTGNIQSSVDGARVTSPVADNISVGNQTVPMMSLANILTGGITIIKDAVPNSGQDFSFAATGIGVQPFILDDDGTDLNPLSSSQTFPGLAGGVRTITETPVPGWSLTNIACTGATLSTIVIGAAGGFDAGDTAVTIGLAAGENVTCTFTNTQLGSITIIKDAVPNNAQDFLFTSPGLTPAGFSLDDDADGTLSNTQAFNGLLPGSRTITETPVAGWALNLIQCTGATASTVVIGAAGGFNAGDTAVTINLAAGENVICTFTNTQLNSITIVKDAVPDNAQNFDFTTTGTGVQNFSLDDDADGTLPNSQAFTGLLPGARTITETAVAGWTLTNIVCSGAESSSVLIGNDADFDPGDTAVSVTLVDGENVTCTFTNTQLGGITIAKDTVPDNAQNFDFITSGAGVQNFSLDDDADGTLPNTQPFTGLLPGARSITEIPVPGWTLTNIVCTGATASTVTIGNDSDFDEGDTSVVIDLAPGENVRCEFINTELGSITIVKNAVPDDAQDFGFTSPGLTPASFSLDDDADGTLSNTQPFPGLLPITRTITETPVAGWTLTNIVCSGDTDSVITIGAAGGFNAGDTSVTIALAPGEDVRCEFTNTRQPSSITIVKDADPNDAQDFAFTTAGDGVQNFNLDDDGNNANTLSNTEAFGTLDPGVRTITETPVAGWTLSNIICTGATNSTVTIGAAGGFDPGDTAVTIALAPGEDVTCTFTNAQQPASITIVKDAVPNDAQDFAFTTAGTGLQNFILDDDGSNVNTRSNTQAFNGLASGVKTITETPVAGWTLTNIICTGATNSIVTIGAAGGFNAGDTAVTVNLAPGENVNCTFTNTKQPPVYGGNDPGDVDPGDPYGQDPVDPSVVNPYVPAPAAPTTTTPVDTNAGVAGDTNPLNPVEDQPQVLAGEAEKPVPSTGGGLLPRTGTGILGEGLLALLLVGAGLVMMRIGRRRRTQTSA